MKDVSHTSQMPEVGDVFSRGPRAMTDGGKRRTGTRTMKDVAHTPPAGDREVDRVFARGNERMASDSADAEPERGDEHDGPVPEEEEEEE